MNHMLRGPSESDNDENDGENNNNAVEERGKNIDGVFYPKKERQIDRLGFETTKHAIHFRGTEWSAVLSNKRDDLTKLFTQNAATATREPEEHIQNLRFIVTPEYLDVKCTVRHKAHTTVQQVQEALAKFAWREVKSLYVPNPNATHHHHHSHRPHQGHHDHLHSSSGAAGDRSGPLSRQHSYSGADGTEKAKRIARELSEYGRANVGPEGVDFPEGKDMDEEPEMLGARQPSTAVVAVAYPS